MLNNYSTTYRVERYNDTAFRVIKTYGSSGNKNVNYNDIYDKSSVEDISLSRTKRNIRRIALSNNFEYFATWTIDSKLCDRFFLSDCVEKMKSLLKAYKRKNKDFKYLYIIEKHKSGAFHFHGLVKGVPIEDLKQFKIGDTMSKKIADRVKKGMIIYHIPFFDNNLGYNTFTKIQSYNRCCNYIIKYISSDTIRTAENQIYFCSRGLSKGESYEVKYIPHELFENGYTFEDICVVRDLYFDTMNKFDFLAFGEIKDVQSLFSMLLSYLTIKKY